jgi:uncharacterized membrane-anchored protein
MSSLTDHPLRYKLANELHARPFPTLRTPAAVAFLALKQPSEAVLRDRSEDLAHLTALIDRYGGQHPQPDATHYSAQLGRYRVKWEQHTEFVTYTAFLENTSDRAFAPEIFDVFPADWLSEAPGQRITSALFQVEKRGSVEDVNERLQHWFVPESLAVSRVVDDAATIAGDFRIDPAGHMRFAIFSTAEIGERRIGRIVQRLCEIETYKSMSMLGFSRARKLSGRINALDNELTELMIEMTEGVAPADTILPQLLSISTELETMTARASFRFAASAAYEAIVLQRIGVLREERFMSRQTFSEFMVRRYDPAMRTVKSTEKRLQSLADRAIRAGDLLRTRVDVERSAQNQKLLESMDRRADLQLRLQRTVEGLSVVAISYYAVSLAGYLLYPLAETMEISKGVMTAAVTLPIVASVWWVVRRIRHTMEADGATRKQLP